MDYSWIVWLLIPAFFICMGGRRSHYSGRRSRHRSSRRYEEISRLKAELSASQDQIDALKARLEAVETIVTDEEADLRWQFSKLQES